jgi:hypothetical protein
MCRNSTYKVVGQRRRFCLSGRKILAAVPQMYKMYGWLKKKRELSEKVLSDFIKFLYRVSPKKKRRVHNSLIYRRILIIYTPN